MKSQFWPHARNFRSCLFPVFLSFMYRHCRECLYRFVNTLSLLSCLILFWVSMNFLVLGYDSWQFSCVPEFHQLWDKSGDVYLCVKNILFFCWKMPCESEALLFTNLTLGSFEWYHQNAKRPVNLLSIPIHLQKVKQARKSSKPWRQENY